MSIIAPATSLSPHLTSTSDIKTILLETCRVPSVRDFQLKHATDLVEGKDLFLVISPGMGKTLVIHAPLLVAHHRGETGIALIIVPTKLLAEQQVSSVTTISVIVD